MPVDPFVLDSTIGARRQKAVVTPLDGLGVDSSSGANLTALSGTNLAGTWLNVMGIDGAVTYELIKTGAGTCNFQVDGTLDPAVNAGVNSNIVPARYYILGSSGAAAIIAGDTAVAGGSQKIWIGIVDVLPTLRIRLDTVVGTVSITTRSYVMPQ